MCCYIDEMEEVGGRDLRRLTSTLMMSRWRLALGLRSILYMRVSAGNFMCLILELAAAYCPDPR